MEGDVLESTSGASKAYKIPKGKCWVLADNENLSVSEADDSRSFGPLKLKNIFGRVLYSIRNENDHGAVNNNELSMVSSIVIACE